MWTALTVLSFVMYVCMCVCMCHVVDCRHNHPQTTDNAWQLQFVKGVWLIVLLVRDEVIHVATGTAVYPADLEDW